MPQNAYAEWFINMMLGWIRWVANSIAAMFQSTSSRGSAGSAFVSWFGEHWIALLAVLVVIGLLIDWLVWMVRWRPYWLWFRKKRVLLDDDIDAILNDEELLRQFGMSAPKKPHFVSSQPGRAGRPVRRDDPQYAPIEDVDDEWFDAPDIEDPYLDAIPLEDEVYEDEDDDLDIEPRRQAVRTDSDEDYEDDIAFDELYDEVYDSDNEEDEDLLPYDEDDEPDIGFLEGDEAAMRPAERRGWLTRLRHRRKHRNEDPFSVDDDEFFDDDEDTEFLSAISTKPVYPQYNPDPQVASIDDESDDEYTFDGEIIDIYEPLDHHAGYGVEPSAAESAPKSRRARRQRRENTK